MSASGTLGRLNGSDQQVGDALTVGLGQAGLRAGRERLPESVRVLGLNGVQRGIPGRVVVTDAAALPVGRAVVTNEVAGADLLSVSHAVQSTAGCSEAGSDLAGTPHAGEGR